MAWKPHIHGGAFCTLAMPLVGRLCRHYFAASARATEHHDFVWAYCGRFPITFPHHATDLLAVYQPETCHGAYVLDQQQGEIIPLLARETILATGGLGQPLFAYQQPLVGRVVTGWRWLFGPGRALPIPSIFSFTQPRSTCQMAQPSF